jgi:transcriptional regulator with XRE-family HTH domain
MAKSVFGGGHQDLVQVLIDARKSSGLTQEQLAQALGKEQQFVSLIENSQRRVDVLEFVAICRAMKLNPERLFGLLLERLPAKFEI